jgi:hypothetical protein
VTFIIQSFTPRQQALTRQHQIATSSPVTKPLNRRTKLTDGVKYWGRNWHFVNFKGVIDETCNFGGVFDYLLGKEMYEIWK